MARVSIGIVGLVLFLSFPISGAADCIPAPANLTAWWTGDGFVEDLAGGNDGTVIDVTFVGGVVDQAFSFDGDDDYFSVPDDPSLRAVTEFTIEFWVNFNTLPTGPLSNSLAICEKHGNYVLYWRADTERLELAFFDNQSSPGYRIGANMLLPDITGAWHHIAVTSVNPLGQPTADFHFYLDGVEQPSFPNVNPPSVPLGWNTSTTGEVFIGRRTEDSLGAYYFDGLIDELDFFDRVLTPAEVGAIYAAGSDGKCKGPFSDTVFADGFEDGDTSQWSAVVQ